MGAMRSRQAILPTALCLLALSGPPALAATWNGSHHTACLARAAGQPEEALEYARSWEATGGGLPARHCIAAALVGLGRYAEAGQLYEELINSPAAAEPQTRAGLLAEAGNVWLLAGDPGRAIAALDAAIALAPRAIALYVDRAVAYALAGDYWHTIDDLNRAEDLDPGRAEIFIYRATAYRYLEVYDLALEDIERALALEPLNPDALLERGNLKRLTGDTEGARSDWLLVLEVAPEGAAADAARDNLALMDLKAD